MTRLPDFITFTGADERTSIMGMIEIQKQFPVEWGILFSESLQGLSNRFPNKVHIAKIEAAKQLKLSAHLCGEYVRRIMKGNFNPLSWNFTPYHRMQINHHVGKFNFERVIDFSKRVIPQKVICHFSDPYTFPDNANVQWLFDTSYGTGSEPEQWPVHTRNNRLVGYAGGIGPENVERIIQKINSKGPYWLDMEQNVRTADWFDLEKCYEVCEKVYGKNENN